MRLELFPAEQTIGQGEPSPEQRLAQAWAQRQARSTESAAMLDALEPELQGQPALQARALTIRAEHAQLERRSEDARTCGAAAQALFMDLGDLLGQADVLLTLALLDYDEGNLEQGDALLLRVVALAEEGGDRLRAHHARLTLGCWLLFRDRERADALVADVLGTPVADLAPALQARAAHFQGIRASFDCDWAAAVGQLVLAHHAALATGQLKVAIVTACTIAFYFDSLLDPEHSLAWVERGSQLASATPWPVMIANCRYQMGTALVLLDRLPEARALFEDLQNQLQGQTGLRLYSQAQSSLAHLLLQQGEPDLALPLFTALAQRAADQGYFDLEVKNLIGIARACLALGRLDAARLSVQQAQTRAQERDFASGELRALVALASIERQAHPDDPGVALELLQQAEQLVERSSGLVLNPEVLVDKADALAALGQHQAAFEAERRARLDTQAQATQDAQRRALALQAHFQSERLAQENEHLRQLAQVSAERFAALSDSHDILSTLGRIGQEITAALQPEQMFERLDRHLHALLELNAFTVYALNEGQQTLDPLYTREDQRPLAAPAIALDSPLSNCAACVRERRLLLLAGDGVTPSPSQIPGASPMGSMMFAPLQIGERVVGAISLQARRCEAFGERAIGIFKNLSAYVAVALDNALAYSNVAELQHRLAEQEKLAALGSLVAGVAHEMNTPVGNSLLAATTLQSELAALREKLAAGSLKRSDMSDFLAQSDGALDLVLRGLQRSSALVKGFKTLAVHQDGLLQAQGRETVRLHELCHSALQLQAPRLAAAGIRAEVLGPADLQLDCQPAVLAELLELLLDNALIHAFAGGQGSRLSLQLSREPGHIELAVQDDGCGIAADLLPRIFEPFVTTRFGQGGNGLGLSRARNLAHGLLQGELRASSQPGQGSCFTLRLPLLPTPHSHKPA